MKPIFTLGAVALALALPLCAARADDKADGVLAEVAAKAKTITSFSAKLSLKFLPSDPKIQGAGQTMAGSMILAPPGKVRFALATPQGPMLILADGKNIYQVMGKQFQKLPPEATEQVNKGVWPPLLGTVGDFVGGTKETKYITQKMLDENTVVDVVDVTGPQGTVRAYIDRDSLVRKVRITTPQSTQDLSLTEIEVNPTLSATAFALPAGVTEQKAPEGTGGGLDAKLVGIGKTPPAFTLATPKGGKLSLAQVSAGKKATLINFWFVGCPPCREEFPELQKLYVKLKDAGFGLVGINNGDDDPEINAFLKEKKISFPIVKATEATIEKFGIQAFPTNYLLDSSGKVVYRSVGFDEAGLKAALKKLGLE
jgi:thiol-disulfide isomerase/thioredoxin